MFCTSNTVFFKFVDEIRVINFEPIEIYVSLMIVICLIFINLNFFENFFQDMMLQIQMSQFIILDIQLSHLAISRQSNCLTVSKQSICLKSYEAVHMSHKY